MKSENIGNRIQRFMEQKELSVDDLVQRTGFQTDFVLSVLRDDVYPSLGPLVKIARALGVRLGTFLDDQVSRDPLIVRKDERRQQLTTLPQKNAAASHRFFSLGQGKRDRHMEPFFVEVLPEQPGDKPLSSHEGEEFIVVQSGRLEVVYGQEKHILEAGDSIYYNSVVPHYVSCAGDAPATIYAVLYFPE